MADKALLIWISNLNPNAEQENRWIQHSFNNDVSVHSDITEQIDSIHLRLLESNSEGVPQEIYAQIDSIIDSFGDHSILSNYMIVFYLSDWVQMLETKNIDWHIVAPFISIEKFIPAQLKSELDIIKANSTIFNRISRVRAFNTNLNQHHTRLLETWKLIYTNLKNICNKFPNNTFIHNPTDPSSLAKLSETLIQYNYITKTLTVPSEDQKKKSTRYKDQGIQEIYDFFESKTQ